MASPERFLNRELSWLQFNWRVLEEAGNTHHPVLERLRFLSISASNLDEFYMVRVAGLRAQVRNGVDRPGMDGLTPARQLEEINEAAAELMNAQQAAWRDVRAAMTADGVELLGADELSRSERAWLRDDFLAHTLPVITPLAIDPAHPFPFIPNLGFAVVLKLKRESDGRIIASGIIGTDAGNSANEIAWQRCAGDLSTAESVLGNEGASNVEIPGEIELATNEMAIVAEVSMTYEPFIFAGFFEPLTLRSDATFRPRFGALSTISADAPPATC